VGLDLDRMLDKCRRDQWRVDDLDWSVEPRPMSREDEIAVVQYFTDMAGIERLASALFAEQRRRVDDPRLKAIFESFIVDEERHARVAERLADFYDVHHYRDYEMNENLVRFRPHFVNAVRHVSAEIANAYITSGEILLDVALLRSLDDFVDDAMSHQAMEKINRDESRHIAVDFHMVERYCDPELIAREAAEPPPPLRQRLRRAWTFCAMLYTAGPFLRDVFFAPMDLTDPSGKRMMEAFKRIQLMARKKEVAARPFTRFLRTMQILFNHPVVGRVLGRIIVRIVGVDSRVLVELFDEDDERRVNEMSLQDLAEEVLDLKYQTA
jgi:rubrerythrin